MTDELDVVVATIASGWGWTSQTCASWSTRAFPAASQLTSRRPGAGRDGEESECVVLYRGADLGRRKRLVTINAAGAGEAESFFPNSPRCRTGEGEPSAGFFGPRGVEPDLAGVLLGGLEETGLVSRGYDLWGEVEVRRVDEEPEGLREEISRVHAALPGNGTISLLDLARRAGMRPVVAQTALFKLMADEIVEALPRGSLVDIRLKEESLDGEAGERWPHASRAGPGRPTTRSGASRPTLALETPPLEHLPGTSATHKRSPLRRLRRLPRRDRRNCVIS